MSKQEHGRQHCPPGSVAAGHPRPVTRKPLSGGRRPSPLPEDTQRLGSFPLDTQAHADKNTGTNAEMRNDLVLTGHVIFFLQIRYSI